MPGNRKLLNIIRNTRGVLKLIDSSHLLQLANTRFHDPSLRNRISAEAIMRLWLYAGGGLDKWQGFKNCIKVLNSHKLKDIEDLVVWCSGQQRKRFFELPDNVKKTLPEKLMEFLINELLIWKEASGCAIFVPSNSLINHSLSEPILLPFELSKHREVHHCCVRTGGSADDALRGLENGVQNVEKLLKKYDLISKHDRIEISFNTLYGHCEEYLTGDSLGVAVFIAAMLDHKGKHTGPFDIAGSGVIKPFGIENADSSYRLKAETFLQAGIKQIILPPGLEYENDSIYTIQSGNLEFNDIQNIIDSLPSKKAKARDLFAETEKLIFSMRYGKEDSEQVEFELKKILKKSTNNTPRMRQVKSLATMGLASAYCHQGRPEESNKLCEQALSISGISSRYKAIALIRQGVNLTDMALYDDALKMFEISRELINNVEDEIERLDLEMQEAGSRGQTLFQWGLSKKELAQESINALNKACEIAEQLDEDDGEDTPDLPRDKCYLYQAYALLKPEQSDEIRKKVEIICMNDLGTRPYFIRVKWLAAYRAMLTGTEIDWKYFREELPDEKFSWVRGSALKYRAALLAKDGQYALAKEDFEEAVKLTVNPHNPLLTLIGMTAAVQAWNSLKDTEYNEFAEKCRKEALNFFSDLKILKTYKFASDWKEYLEQHGENIKSPQLKYPY